MSENQVFAEGDLVIAEHEDGSCIRGRLTASSGDFYLNRSGRYVKGLIRDGFIITVLEKALPKIPTEPGYYFDKEGDSWRIYTTHEGLYRVADGHMESRLHAPFTRLEPVPETAKKVIEAVQSHGSYWPGSASLDEIAAEFGAVTE